MRVQFRRLLSIGITHEYYPGTVETIGYLVPSECERVMRGGRLVAKCSDGRLDVFYEADEGGAPVVPLAGKTVWFGLRVIDASFFNVSELDLVPGQEAGLHRNSQAPGDLDAPVSVLLSGGILRRVLSRNERPVEVIVTSAEGAILHRETVTGDDGRTDVSLDLSAAMAGPIKILERYPDEVEISTETYRDSELLAEKVIGVVHLVIDASFYEEPPAFTVGYPARKEVLKYYVVAKNYQEKNFEDLTVSDDGYAEEARTPVNFTKVAYGDFGDGELSSAELGGSETDSIVLFRSQELVARRQGGRKGIRLKQNGEILIENLPQPHPDRVSADFIVHLSKT